LAGADCILADKFGRSRGFGGGCLRSAALEEVMGEGLFQPLHILLIVGIALLLFGPSKFADLGKGLGEGIKNFKAAVKDEPKKDEEKKS
jgi:sec-independent protein translocase protein TatA